MISFSKDLFQDLLGALVAGSFRGDNSHFTQLKFNLRPLLGLIGFVSGVENEAEGHVFFL